MDKETLKIIIVVGYFALPYLFYFIHKKFYNEG